MTLASGSGGVNYNTFTAGGMGSGMGYPEGEEENNEEEEEEEEEEENEEEENPCGTGFVQDINGKCWELPCPGDPVSNPRIAGQKNSGIPGGIFGTCTRFFTQDICAPKKRLHQGTDFLNEENEPIFAMFDGMARLQEQEGGAGYHVSIVSQVNGKTVRHVYFHLQQENRASGFVKQGDIIGYQGDSGNLKDAIEKEYTQSHVHLKVEENGTNVNPFKYIKTQFDPATGELLAPCQ